MAQVSHLTVNRESRCVMARIRRQGKMYQANFTLREYGNWTAAKQAAAKWVSGLLKNLPARTFSKGQMTSRNASGVVGVYRHRQTHRKKNGRRSIYHSWIARWPGCKYRGGVKWTVQQFGEEDAFVLAALSRKLETTDRDRVQVELASAKVSGEYRELLGRRKKQRR